MKSSPTSRTLAECKARGWRAEVVERYNPHARVRHDLFGWIDIVALDGQPGLLGIQATSGANVSARVAKIRQICWPAALAWLQAGNRVAVWGWAKKGPRGKRKTWQLREVYVTEMESAITGGVES